MLSWILAVALIYRCAGGDSSALELRGTVHFPEFGHVWPFAAVGGAVLSWLLFSCLYDWRVKKLEKRIDSLEASHKKIKTTCKNLCAVTADCHYVLGSLQAEGCVSKNYKIAVRHFAIASDYGSNPARLKMAYCLYKGYGVAQSEAKAFEQWRAAADNGSEVGHYNVAMCYNYGMCGVSECETTALVHLRKAADRDHAGALYMMGLFYREGKAGLSKSESEAKRFITAAIERGYCKFADIFDM